MGLISDFWQENAVDRNKLDWLLCGIAGHEAKRDNTIMQRLPINFEIYAA